MTGINAICSCKAKERNGRKSLRDSRPHLFKLIHSLLQTIQKPLNMPAISDGVVTGDGKRQQKPFLLFAMLSHLHRGKVIGLSHTVAVRRIVPKRHPRHTGNGVGIGRRRFRFSQQAVITSIRRFIPQKVMVEYFKFIIVFRPHQRKGFGILMEHCI